MELVALAVILYLGSWPLLYIGWLVVTAIHAVFEGLLPSYPPMTSASDDYRTSKRYLILGWGVWLLALCLLVILLVLRNLAPQTG